MTQTIPPIKYSYAFTVWVNPSHKWSKEFVEWVRRLQCRVEYIFTEDEFMQYRYNMLKDGMELHEIERVPYVEPELVL